MQHRDVRDLWFLLMFAVVVCFVAWQHNRQNALIESLREQPAIVESPFTVFVCPDGDDSNPYGRARAPVKTMAEAERRSVDGGELYICAGSKWHEGLHIKNRYSLTTVYRMDEYGIPRHISPHDHDHAGYAFIENNEVSQ